jgi:hypothetical protein
LTEQASTRRLATHASRTFRDDIATEEHDQERRRIWNGLDREAQQMVRLRGDELSNEL